MPGQPNPNIVEPVSDFIRNERGEWLLVIPAIDGEPDHPAFSVDATGAEAVLYRSGRQVVALPGLHPAAAQAVARLPQILVAEMNGGEPRRVYAAAARSAA